MEQLAPAKKKKLREIAPLIPEGLPGGLRNYWYPLLQSEELTQDHAISVRALGEKIAIWRGSDGRPQAVHDRCPHRGMKLSVGRILDGQLQCVLHGLRFDGGGRCVLIPWEKNGDHLTDRLAIKSFPAEELGGYVWVYVGDADKHPPPPLADEVPEELSNPDEFIWFRLPTEVWKANWLLTIDGGDGYHAVTLHAGSQAVSDRKYTGGQVAEAGVPLKDRRVKIVETSHGVRGVSIDTAGRPIHHGHFTTDVRGDRFTLPCIHTNPIVAAPGAAPYAARLWQFPIDETSTQVVRFLSWRAKTEDERRRAEQLFHDVALPRLQKVSREDAWAAEEQGDLIEARSDERLLQPDKDLIKLRRLIRDAFVAQARGSKRLAVRDGALVFPV